MQGGTFASCDPWARQIRVVVCMGLAAALLMLSNTLAVAAVSAAGNVHVEMRRDPEEQVATRPSGADLSGDEERYLESPTSKVSDLTIEELVNKAIRSDSHGAAEEAVAELKKRRVQAVPFLAKSINDQMKTDLFWHMFLLMRLEFDDPQIIDAAEEVLKENKYNKARAMAADFLGGLGRKAAKTLPTLREKAQDPDETQYVVESCSGAIVKIETDAGGVPIAKSGEVPDGSTARPTPKVANEKGSRVYGRTFAEEASFCIGYFQNLAVALGPPSPGSLHADLAEARERIHSALVSREQLSNKAETEGRRRALEDRGYSAIVGKAGTRNDPLTAIVIMRCQDLAGCLKDKKECDL